VSVFLACSSRNAKRKIIPHFRGVMSRNAAYQDVRTAAEARAASGMLISPLYFDQRSCGDGGVIVASRGNA
jgi:hypothetical protein